MLVLWVVGCSPSVPTQTEARAAFDERRARIEGFEDSIFTHMAMHQDMTPAQAEVLVVGAGALGFDGATRLPSVPPCVGGTGPGDVPPEQGISVEHYAIGYGLYQTAWDDGRAHGDGDLHPGIAVRWQLAAGEAVITEPITLCFLLDGTPRPK
jgi:hypothetical protein